MDVITVKRGFNRYLDPKIDSKQLIECKQFNCNIKINKIRDHDNVIKKQYACSMRHATQANPQVST